MIKTVIYISFGYIVYKIVKNGAYLAINAIKSKKELSDSTELVKCDYCDGFVSSQIAYTRSERVFCDEKCAKKFFVGE
jgi:hypothetical protein